MKRNALALGVAATIGALGFAGSASALVINTGGVIAPAAPYPGVATVRNTTATKLVVSADRVGHILLGEYFTTQNGNATMLHITNTDPLNGKAVKVRFRGATNSDDVFDFTLLMSPSDMWTGAVVADEKTGISTMITADTSCTLPAINGKPFPTDRLPPSPLKTDEQRASMTREGYIEILNMANIPGNGAANNPGKEVYAQNLDTDNKPGALFRTVKHSSGKPACDSAVLAASLKADPADWAAAAKAGLDFPTGGLFANVSIVNVPNTASYANQAVALKAVTDALVSATANFVFFPQVGDKAVAAPADINGLTADPLLRQLDVNNTANAAMSLPRIEAAKYDLPDLSTPYLVAASTPLDANGPIKQSTALTASLASASVMNEFNTESGVAGATDWVFSMPTRRYHVAMDYATVAKGSAATFDGRVFTTGGASGAAFAYGNYFTNANTSVDSDKLRICVDGGDATMFDREETTKSSGFVISPGTATKVSFCGETSVLSFYVDSAPAPAAGSPSSVLASTEAVKFMGTPYQNGWANLVTPAANPAALALLAPPAVNGVPVIGSSYIRLTNAKAKAGVSGNYGLVFKHR